ncbi:MAG: translocation/assembly module TamB domain-containing protein [Gomphosphaeria aponina SAG 52.96 = DSM 107014]|uniref:Translocation/assembly module TamB domain-containing protein n=1 Tax=Gomphosphaeria aponina SAG 52.96 = DSM 107014 TaxID=1521640 RepID=A0A941GSU4_9CHRO|nr:translocation/assembly module TamB domain-containing protein [Gomphosphaeria aponina SAG 52.96 = DSM 107014]
MLTIISVLLLTLGGSLTYGWFLITRKLAPVAEKELTNLLNRPVKIGAVEGFALGGVRFASSEIPPTPTDPDRVTVEAVNVGFNPVKLLLANKLELNVTLLKPDFYIEQDINGHWVSTDINTPTPSGSGLQVQLKKLQIKDAQVTLVGRSATDTLKPPVELEVSRATGTILPDLITFNLTGKLAQGGELKLINSKFQPASNELTLGIQAKKLAVTAISNLLPLPLHLQSGTAEGNLQIKLKNGKVNHWQGNTHLNDVTFTIEEVMQSFSQTNGNLLFQGTEIELENVSTFFDLIPGIANGIIDTQGEYNILVQTEPVATANVIKTLQLPQPSIPISGEIKGAIQVTGPLDNPLINFDVTTTKTATINQVEFTSITANLQLQNSTLFIPQFQAIPKVGGETLGSGKIQLQDTNFLFDLQANNVPTNNTILPFSLGQISGKTQITGFLNQPESITATGAATAGGLTTKNFQLKQGKWSTILAAEQVKLSQLLPEFSHQVQGEINGTLNLEGNWGDWQDIRGKGTASLTAAGGKVIATNLEIANGSFSTLLIPEAIALNSFSENLRGELSGKLKVRGSLNPLNFNSIQATGALNFSEGIALIDRPLTTKMHWQGEKIEITEIRGKGVGGSGLIAVNLAGKTSEIIQELDLEIQAEEIQLESLPISGLEIGKIKLLGTTDFTGKITGNPNSPTVKGDLTLHNFTIAGNASGNSFRNSFESLLTGKVEIIPGEKVNLELAGVTDRIDLILDKENRPTTFLLQQNEIIAQGVSKGELLAMKVENIPLNLVKNYALQHSPKKIAAIPIGGKLNGEININWNSKATKGTVEVQQPVLGAIIGDRFLAQVQYIDGIGSVTEGKLVKGESEYLFNGSLNTKAENSYVASVQIVAGEIQDILQTLQIFEVSDLSNELYSQTYGSAADLYSPGEEQPLFAVGLPEKTILEQIGKLAEIQEEIADREKNQKREAVPKLANLRGTINGTVEVEGKETGITGANFNLEGKEWEWGEYKIKQAIAVGNYENGLLNLQPINIKIGENSEISLKGVYGGESQNGELQLTNFPLKLAQNYLPAHLKIDGMADANIQLAGSQKNPLATGEITINKGTINQTSLKSTQGKFNYQNARLDFFFQSLWDEKYLGIPDINWQGSNLNRESKFLDKSPLLITGSFPYQLPFASVKPDHEQFNLKLNIKDSGLMLLNIFSQGQLNWVDGKGEVKLDIAGNFDQEKLQIQQTMGNAKIENGTIAAQFFPKDPLTEINGAIGFNLDRITVENLKGKFSGGEVQINGTLPLTPATPQENPLTVNLQNLALNLRGIYQGNALGNINITGTVFQPKIGGQLQLFDGKIQLTPTQTLTGISNQKSLTPEIYFNNLQFKLGENVQIIQTPVLNFFAEGSLSLNGTKSELLPEGSIQLKGGQVNLFASQLRLAEGAKNTARFFPNHGLDPYLDIQLIGLVSETNRNQIPIDPSSPEIRDLPQESLGSLQTIRIEANVNGFASQLTNNINLSSSPPRSEKEIIALLGGGFINNFGTNESTLGLANLAGKAFFGSFQGHVADAFGLSQFAIFPTQIIEETQRTSTLGLGGEISIDIANRFSFSVLKILTNEQKPQFGFRYRLNNNILLRGSSNFNNESRGVIEYQQRF